MPDRKIATPRANSSITNPGSKRDKFYSTEFADAWTGVATHQTIMMFFETTKKRLRFGQQFMNDWTDAELEAAVDAYLAMLNAENAGQPYSKSDANSALRESALISRTKGSVEYRMQNISAVIEEIGQPWLPGYKPARNVGVGVKQRLLRILHEQGFPQASN